MCFVRLPRRFRYSLLLDLPGKKKIDIVAFLLIVLIILMYMFVEFRFQLFIMKALF